MKLTSKDLEYIVTECTKRIVEAHGQKSKKSFKDDFGKMKNPKMNKPIGKFNYSNYKDDMDESVNEAHGVKKHNMPKDKNAAMRKGNREAERDIYGDGFKSKNKIHNPKGYSRKNNKVSIDDMIDEAVSKTLKEFIMPNEPSTDYEGNDLDFNSIVDQAVSVIVRMEENGEEISWSEVARNMGFRLETLNEEDMELLHDAIEHAMALLAVEDENNVDEF